MANLANFIDECLGIATANGLSPTEPVLITIKSGTTGVQATVVCAYSEPHNLVLPLNVTWIDSDPASPDYKDAYKRVSKDPVGQMLNTWEEVLTYDDIFEPPQFYDDDDLPIVEAREADVQKAISHVDENVLSGDPHQARFYTDLRINSVNAAIQEAVNKNNHNYELILALMTAVDTLTERVQTLEDSGGGVDSMVYVQETPQQTWLVEHNFDTENVICQMYDAVGIPILPSTMGPTDSNAWEIRFETPIAGKVILVGL